MMVQNLNPYYFLFSGGWANPLIVDWFVDYARVAYTLFGDRVKWWITINEPLIICDVVYNSGLLAPSIISPEVGNHLCTKNVVMAHAKAYRVYDEEFRAKYHGELANIVFYKFFLGNKPTKRFWFASLIKRNLYFGDFAKF